jgi:hypothetical protein
MRDRIIATTTARLSELRTAASTGALRRSLTRSRLEVAGAAAACAFVVGLSAPAAGIVDSATAAPETTSVAESPVPALEATQASFDDTLQAFSAAVAPVAPTEQELHPMPVTASQQTFTPSHGQLANAKAIVEAGKAMGLPPRAWTIAVATSLQESNLNNLGHLGSRNDHDSLGLFQQRPSSGWGTPAQITDPNYAATAFYSSLVEVPGWDSLPLTRAAQKVQVSAFPNHYAKHEVQAGNIIKALYGAGPYADLATDLR